MGKTRKQRGRGVGPSRLPTPARTLFDIIRGDYGETDEEIQQQVDDIQALIDAGADVNTTDENGLTPLIALIIDTPFDEESASMPFYEDLIPQLAGNDINYMAADGSALHYAAKEMGKEEYIRYLINNGANINLQNARGETPLFLASTKSNTTEVRVLCEIGADVNIPDAQGRTPVQVIGINRDPLTPEDFNQWTLEYLCLHGAHDGRCIAFVLREQQRRAQLNAQRLLMSYPEFILPIESQGFKDIPEDRMENMLTYDDFIDGEPVIVISENGFEFIYKVESLQKWFDTKTRSGHSITNPGTGKSITSQNQITRWIARVPKRNNSNKNTNKNFRKSRKSRKSRKTRK